MEINDYVKEAYETSKSKGWYDNGGHTPAEAIALMHSELSEALESLREGWDPATLYFVGDDAKPTGPASEFADVLIRIFDFCGHHGVDLQSAVEIKMAYNKTREYRHGNKKL